MYPGEIAMLALIIGAFLVFGVTVFWVSQDSPGAPTPTRQPSRRDSRGAYPAGAQVVIDD